MLQLKIHQLFFLLPPIIIRMNSFPPIISSSSSSPPSPPNSHQPRPLILLPTTPPLTESSSPESFSLPKMTTIKNPLAVGLDPAVINSYPKFQFRKDLAAAGSGCGENGNNTCSICLSLTLSILPIVESRIIGMEAMVFGQNQEKVPVGQKGGFSDLLAAVGSQAATESPDPVIGASAGAARGLKLTASSNGSERTGLDIGNGSDGGARLPGQSFGENSGGVPVDLEESLETNLLDPGGQQGGIGFAELLDPDGHILALPFSSQLKWRSYCRMRLVMEKMEVVALMWVGGGEAPLAAKIEHVIVNGSNVCGLDGGVAVVMDVIVKGANKKMRVAVDMPVASLESNGVGVKFPDPIMG